MTLQSRRGDTAADRAGQAGDGDCGWNGLRCRGVSETNNRIYRQLLVAQEAPAMRMPNAAPLTALRICVTVVVMCIIITCLAVTAFDERTAAAQPVEPYAKPFPRRWVEWIFDEELVRRPPEAGRSHTPALQPGDLQLSVVLWPGTQISAGEPLIARLSIIASGEKNLVLPFIGGVDEAIHFAVTTADGRRVGRPYQPPPSRMDGMVATFPAGVAKRYETIVSYWYDFAQPGEYTVEGQLIVIDGHKLDSAPITLSSQTMTVSVLPRDAARLEEQYAQIFHGERHQGEKYLQPVELADGSLYRPSDDACRRALLHVTDEAVLPYLSLMVQIYRDYRDVVTAISYVDSPKAVTLLHHLAEYGRGKAPEHARAELERLGIAPSAPPRQAALPSPITAKSLIERLCERPGLALVADPEAAQADIGVRADPSAPVAEIAAALAASGLRAYNSAGGEALVILGAAAEGASDADADRFVTASRLLETVTPEQVSHREQGYIKSPHLTQQQLELIYSLLRLRPGTPRREQTPANKLALGIWRISGFELVLRAGEEAIVTHGGGVLNYAPPLELMPEPLDGSVLWWYWPYAMSPHLADELVSAGPVWSCLREMPGQIPAGLRPEAASAAADKLLLVSAQQAPLGHLIWALEVATGLPALAPGKEDTPVWTFTSDRYPKQPVGTDAILRLPALGCRSPHLTPGGAAVLAGPGGQSRVSARPLPAWNARTLPLVYRQLVLDWIANSQSLRRRLDTDYEALAAEGGVVVFWPQGVHLEPAVVEPDGSSGSRPINLPVF